jgi:hypothetical protein
VCYTATIFTTEAEGQRVDPDRLLGVREAKPATVQASAGTPTAQYRHQQLMSFRGNSRYSYQNGGKYVKKGTKE